MKKTKRLERSDDDSSYEPEVDKRLRSEQEVKKDDTSLNQEIDLKVVYAAFEMVRLSSIVNMMNLDIISVYVLCILAFWERDDLSSFLNEVESFRTAAKAWLNGTREQHEEWQKLADALPLGKDYVDSMLKFSNDAISPLVKAFIKRAEYDKLSQQKDEYARFVLEFVRDLASQCGRHLRDVVQVATLKREYNDNVLAKTAACNPDVLRSFLEHKFKNVF